jgi:hypothetical protein
MACTILAVTCRKGEAVIVALLLQAASLAVPTITLPEARTMSPSALGDRLLIGRAHGPIVDAIVNGRGGLTPPSQSVNRIWLVERMVPFDAMLCRSHVFDIEMGASDPAANHYRTSLPSHPVKIGQYDRLWMPAGGKATAANCAAAPPRQSGFGDGGLGLRQAADLVEQARAAVMRGPHEQKFSVDCHSERNACGVNARKTLAAIDWGRLGMVSAVKADGTDYYVGDRKPPDAKWGPSHVQFTFPYAAGGATWVITVDRSPDIVAVRMSAPMIIYE